jgi:hypothetical protein
MLSILLFYYANWIILDRVLANFCVCVFYLVNICLINNYDIGRMFSLEIDLGMKMRKSKKSMIIKKNR